ncbi:tetraspanin-13 [Caerostris darwini]|uniref:Tetraspanin-13 n=1 Tax=Caerostris darwini TaxID=1538125 RepID=A0AAV4SM15_9ARAC|nr:tetraspanin-13 [Caerostris darwini]
MTCKLCSSFTCLKNALIALNIVYILVSFILIGVAAYCRAASVVTNLAIVGGIIACGVFLFLLSVMGLIGAIQHHQVMLFFYMLILFLLFIIQFSIACACLAVTTEQQHQLAMEGWKRAKVNIKVKAQTLFNCYGFENQALSEDDLLGGGVPFQKITKCVDPDGKNRCPPCWNILRNAINNSLKICGGIGLFFSFSEFVGVWLTVRYRNQRDPRANPSAFL